MGKRKVIKYISKLIEEIESSDWSNEENQAFIAWRTKTVKFVKSIYGENSSEFNEIGSSDWRIILKELDANVAHRRFEVGVSVGHGLAILS